MARSLVLIPYLSRLADAIIFRKGLFTPPLVRYLDPTRGIGARSLICGLHRPERMVTSWLDVECDTHIFDGTNFAWWKHHMLDHFRAKGPKFWWIVTSGLTHVLDHRNLTEAQKVLFELDAHAYCYLMDALSFELFDKVNSKGIAHEM